MASRVEVRRSRHPDRSAVAGGTRSAQPTSSIVDRVDTPSASSLCDGRVSHTTRKRARAESGQDISRDTSVSSQKKIKLQEREDEVGDHPDVALPAPSKISDCVQPQKRPCKGLSKKAVPLAQRMEVLKARFARLVNALTTSEAAHVDAKISEIRRGCCEEFTQAMAPIEATRELRTAIARKRNTLQKAQADREWHAARTSAHYDFVKCRGDMRASMRQAVSEQVFDLSRNYRDMSAEMLGVNLDQKLLERSRAKKVALVPVQHATLTEKDEDLLMMNIQPASLIQPELDATLLTAVPILQKMVPNPPPSRPSSRQPSRPPSRPPSRFSLPIPLPPKLPLPPPLPLPLPSSYHAIVPKPEITSTPPNNFPPTFSDRALPFPHTERPASRIATSNQLQNSSLKPTQPSSRPRISGEGSATQSGPLPGINSFLRHDTRLSHVSPLSRPRRPYRPSDSTTQSHASGIKQFPPPLPSASSPLVSDPSRSGFGRHDSHTPYTSAASKVSPLLVPANDTALPYYSSQAPKQSPTYGRPDTWSQQEASPFTTRPSQPPSSTTLQPINTGTSVLDVSPTQHAMSSNSAFNATIGTQAQYVVPGHPQYAALQAQTPVSIQRPFQASAAENHYQQRTQQSVPFPPPHSQPQSQPDPQSYSTPSSFNRSSHRRTTSHDFPHGKGHNSLLHPFRNSETSILPNPPRPPASVTLPFPHVINPALGSGKEPALTSTTPTTKETNGILWGGLRR